MLSAQQLEEGDTGFSGRFGNGAGKWQLFVSADRPIQVMSLLYSRPTETSPTCHADGLQGETRRKPTIGQCAVGDRNDQVANRLHRDGLVVHADNGTGGRARSPLLVEYLPSTEFDIAALSADQVATLDAIRGDPAAIDIRVGPANVDAVREALALSLVLPAPPGSDSEATASFHDLNLEERTETDYSLYFRVETSESEVALVVLGPDVLGTIRYDGALYKVHPLGDGLTAVYRYGTSRLPPHATLGEPVADKRRQRDAVPRSAGAAASNGSPVIDVLVAYTPRARIHAGNVDALLRFAFDETNRIYANRPDPVSGTPGSQLSGRVRARSRLVHGSRSSASARGLSHG